MSYTKLTTALGLVVLLAGLPTPATAQGRRGGGSHGSGRAAPREGVAAPRGAVRGDRATVLPSRSFGYPAYRYPYRYGYRSYYYGRPYYYGYPGFSMGLYYGYPSYWYPSYGYPYYGGSYGYGYPGYGGYGYSGYVAAGRPYGAVRIDLPQRDAEVYVDGYYAGIVDDFDGTFQHVSLEAGPHHLEIRAPGFESISFDVNVEPGRTITYRTAMRPGQP